MAGGLTYHRSVLSAADWGTFGAVDDSDDDLTLSPLTSERKRVAGADTGGESPPKRNMKLPGVETLKLPHRDK